VRFLLNHEFPRMLTEICANAQETENLVNKTSREKE